MLKTLQRTAAVIIGALLFCYPAYLSIAGWLTTRTRFPQNAAASEREILYLGVVYVGILTSVVLYARHVRRIVRTQSVRGRDVFTGGLMASIVLFVAGFFGPLVYGWATRTEVGNMTPIIGVLGLAIGIVLSAGAALIAYGIVGAPSAEHKGSER